MLLLLIALILLWLIGIFILILILILILLLFQSEELLSLVFLLPFLFLLPQFFPFLVKYLLFIVIDNRNLLNTSYKLFKAQIATIGRNLLKVEYNGIFIHNFLLLIPIPHERELKILQKQKKPLHSKMHFLILQSFESHMFPSFEDMGTVMFENPLQVVQSKQAHFGAAIDH